MHQMWNLNHHKTYFNRLFLVCENEGKENNLPEYISGVLGPQTETTNNVITFLKHSELYKLLNIVKHLKIYEF